ncbi:unnamed protein product [Musa acuminata subsp. malaccensis]|uniref:(wild Malaysian banana) hypothetical protein n=1 Tax=Musa acuminata subsp. malaccensis TaxID=214687 RepID=A0A804K6J9_MUSAM|nr:unnamed protein product [Musa acuminata subsp. malaccensis]
MKEWSQRYPVAEPSDDWREGSWTVDCSCGVTFDDGEEMVSCDECGVWVHTRCSGYVRGEASFACHYCKAAARRLRFASGSASASAVGPHRRRLWAGIPLEDRVHVQGVPGGDPYLFGDLSSVFSSQLWRCTGYVPKKINFRYREFPCWEEEGKEGEENENPANRGADVQFSFSEKIIPYITVKKFDEDAKEEEANILLRSCRAKGARGLQVFGQANLDKKRKEEPGEAEDHGAKKKARTSPDKISFYAGQSEMKRSNTMKIQVKLETPDRLKTVNDESNLKMNLASQGGVSDSRKESSIDQVRGRAIYCFKQPKDESNFEGCIDKLLAIDKELALLLYQGLNSSHRVPRMPRVWQAAGLQPTSTIDSVQRKGRSFGVPKEKQSRCNERCYLQFSDLNGENRERGRMLGQKYQQSPDDLTIILASGEGGKSDLFSSFEVSEQTWSSPGDVP